MRRASALISFGAVLLLAVTAPAPATAVQLVTAAGQPAPGPWQRWADHAPIPTIRGPVQFGTLDCAGAPACTETPQRFAGPYDISMPGGAQLTVTPTAVPSNDRDSLYFELGHLFDAEYLTAPDRRYLARAWRLPHWHWWDTTRSLERGGEDGLEVIFASIYDDCAWGQNDDDSSIVMFEPRGVTGPDAHPQINTCIFIRQIYRQATAYGNLPPLFAIPGISYSVAVWTTSATGWTEDGAPAATTWGFGSIRSEQPKGCGTRTPSSRTTTCARSGVSMHSEA